MPFVKTFVPLSGVSRLRDWSFLPTTMKAVSRDGATSDGNSVTSSSRDAESSRSTTPTLSLKVTVTQGQRTPSYDYCPDCPQPVPSVTPSPPPKNATSNICQQYRAEEKRRQERDLQVVGTNQPVFPEVTPDAQSRLRSSKSVRFHLPAEDKGSCRSTLTSRGSDVSGAGSVCNGYFWPAPSRSSSQPSISVNYEALLRGALSHPSTPFLHTRGALSSSRQIPGRYFPPRSLHQESLGEDDMEQPPHHRLTANRVTSSKSVFIQTPNKPKQGASFPRKFPFTRDSTYNRQRGSFWETYDTRSLSGVSTESSQPISTASISCRSKIFTVQNPQYPFKRLVILPKKNHSGESFKGCLEGNKKILHLRLSGVDTPKQ